jgi:hypothetical protein
VQQQTRRQQNPKGSKVFAVILVPDCAQILERKIRRELLVLMHCMRQQLPNLTRLISVVLPDWMDEDYDDEGNNNNNNEADDGNDYALIRAMNNRKKLSLLQQKAAAITTLNRRKQQ